MSDTGLGCAWTTFSVSLLSPALEQRGVWSYYPLLAAGGDHLLSDGGGRAVALVGMFMVLILTQCCEFCVVALAVCGEYHFWL